MRRRSCSIWASRSRCSRRRWAATYGTQVVNVKVAKEHEEDGDFGNTWMMTFAEGTGTGPYKITDFQPGDTVTLEKYDGYWAGWEGDHFDKIIVRTVNESQTMRQLLEIGRGRHHRPDRAVAGDGQGSGVEPGPEGRSQDDD